jgi:hypothetical protein
MTLSSSMRTGSKGLVGLGVCVAALLVALILAGAAQAAEPTGVEIHEPISTEQAPTAPPAEPVVEEPATPPASEPVTEEPATPPATEPVTEEPATPPATEPVTEAPVTSPASEPVTEAPVTPPASEPVVEETVTPPAVVAEETELGAEETSTHAGSPVLADQHASAAPAEGEGEVEDEDPPETPGAPIASPTTMASQGALPLPSSAAAPARRSLDEPAGALNGQLADNLSCALSGLGGFQAGGCGPALFGTQILLSPSPDGLDDETVGSRATATDASADGDHDGSTADYRPAQQAPGPGPGGASGGSAVGGSGVACSSCQTLAGLLRLGGPRAMRRLRLSCEPWLTACFVLIPERPG